MARLGQADDDLRCLFADRLLLRCFSSEIFGRDSVAVVRHRVGRPGGGTGGLCPGNLCSVRAPHQGHPQSPLGREALPEVAEYLLLGRRCRMIVVWGAADMSPCRERARHRRGRQHGRSSRSVLPHLYDVLRGGLRIEYYCTQHRPGPDLALLSVPPVGRLVDADLLVGSLEIAQRLGVKRHQVVHEWRRRDPGFPPPLATVSRSLIWYWPDVEAWARSTGRLRQPPRGPSAG